MRTLGANGTPDAALRDAPILSAPFADVFAGAATAPTVESALLLGRSRAATAPVPLDTAGKIAEIVLEGGVTLYLPADDLPTLAREARGGQGDCPSLELAAGLPEGDQERGLGEWLFRSLRTLDIDLGPLTAREIARRLEGRAVPQPGLYRWGANAGTALELFSPRTADGNAPCLVFVHGTFSNTGGSFGALLQPERRAEWRRLRALYDDRILAFEHPTLTQSPIANAIDLLEALSAAGREIHLVTHSRGGLVGELLSRGMRADGKDPFDARDIALCQQETDGGNGDLERLNALLKQIRPNITRFVRVACPARGTTLASDRLDKYLNVVLNGVGLLLGAARLPVLGEIYDFVKALLLAVVAERKKPGGASVLPGLEAMRPESPFIRMLNRADVTSRAPLTVIRGDVEAAGVIRRLKVWAADAFYTEDHDFVVNSAAMAGGVARADAVADSFDRGPDVNHFSYFRNDRTAQQVVAGITLSGPSLQQALPPSAEPARPWQPAQRGRDHRPVAFVVPGLAGSTLSADGVPIWPDLRCLAAGGISRLGSDAAGVVAGQLHDRTYGELCRTLEQTHDVRTFPYDWRLSIEDTAAALARALDQALGSGSAPVRIVAHGMGGLVARTALAADSAVLDAFRSRAGCRLIMLGSPNDGTHAAVMMLMGRDRLMRMLAMIDVSSSTLDHAHVVARLPGVLQLLPRDASFDLFSADGWERLHALDPERASWVVPRADDLNKAKAFRDRYCEMPFDAERMVYIAGHAATPCAIEIETPPAAPAQIVFTQTWEGDGQVPWSTGIVAGTLRRWYAACRHGDLPRDSAVLAALGEILDQGSTSRLAAQPGSARERGEPQPVTRETVALFPAAADLEAAAAGGTVQPPARPSLPPLTITVSHGNLAFAAHPVLVGHYNGDTLNGAEGYLNRLLDGRLETRRTLGLYPGVIGTAEVVLDENTRPEGAVVVGLGDPGSLDPAELEQSLVHGLLRYAVAQTERCRGQAVNGTSPAPLRLSLLLVGAGEGGLTVEACVKALSEAIVRAHKALTESHPAGSVYDRIEIIELYEHRAIDIWHALNSLLSADASSRRPLRLAPEINRRDGGRRRVRSEMDRSWWQPVQVSMDVMAGEYLLKVSTAAGRARVEATTVYGTVEMARRLSEQAKRDKAGGPSVETPGRALYELLWPNRLKSEGFGDRNLRLILDERAASLPWELLDDRRSWETALAGKADPPAIRAGLVRQLVQQRYREQTGSTAGRRQALVIGDPRGDPAREYKPLQGAIEEAADVATLLQSNGYAVTRLIGDQVFPEQVISALLSERWQIVHIAAHGDVEHDIAVNTPIAGDTAAGSLQRTRKATGIVLGRNLFLEPCMLEQMPVAPDLFFVNCCHVGGIDSDREAALAARRPELAASIAVQLIRMGVRGVVAAGWAVNDRLARAFATQFYQGFLASQEFGRAVRTAREAAYRKSPADPTWGAYQCYGEPDWRLGAAPAEEPNDEPLTFAAPAEALTEIERIREDAQTLGERDPGALKQRLDAIRHDAIAADEARRPWLARAEIVSACAQAYAELGAIDQAIADYERALKANRGSAAVRDIEQLADLRGRKAVRTAAAGDGAARAAAKEIRAAIQALNRLTALGSTAERHGLIGAAYRRLVTIVGAEEVEPALNAMQKAYEKAWACEQREAPVDSSRPVQRVDRLLMVQAARVARALHRGEPVAPEVVDAIDDCRRDAESAGREQPCFWYDVACADAALLTALAAVLAQAAGASAPPLLQETEADAVAALYGKARRRGGSPLKLSTANEQLDFFIAIAGHSPIAAEVRRDLVHALARIRDRLLP